MWLTGQDEWVPVHQPKETYEVVALILIYLSREPSGQRPSCSRDSPWCSRERLQWGKRVGADKEGKIQQSGTRQRARGYMGGITGGKGDEKKIAWKEPQKGGRGRSGTCARQSTKHNVVKSHPPVFSPLLCVVHHCWTLGMVPVLFYCSRDHFTFWLPLLSLTIFNRLSITVD